MGNQEIKQVMAPVQDRDFDPSKLSDYEAKLWREQEADSLSGFTDILEMNGKTLTDLFPFRAKIDVEKSGIDEDEKRYNEQVKDCWQTGFATREKRIEELKQGGECAFNAVDFV